MISIFCGLAVLNIALQAMIYRRAWADHYTRMMALVTGGIWVVCLAYLVLGR